VGGGEGCRGAHRDDEAAAARVLVLVLVLVDHDHPAPAPAPVAPVALAPAQACRAPLAKALEVGVEGAAVPAARCPTGALGREGGVRGDLGRLVPATVPRRAAPLPPCPWARPLLRILREVVLERGRCGAPGSGALVLRVVLDDPAPVPGGRGGGQRVPRLAEPGGPRRPPDRRARGLHVRVGQGRGCPVTRRQERAHVPAALLLGDRRLGHPQAPARRALPPRRPLPGRLAAGRPRPAAAAVRGARVARGGDLGQAPGPPRRRGIPGGGTTAAPALQHHHPLPQPRDLLSHGREGLLEVRDPRVRLGERLAGRVTCPPSWRHFGPENRGRPVGRPGRAAQEERELARGLLPRNPAEPDRARSEDLRPSGAQHGVPS